MISPLAGVTDFSVSQCPYLVSGYQMLYPGVQLTTRLQLVPRPSTLGAVPPLALMPFWRPAPLVTGAILYGAVFNDLHVVTDLQAV